MLHTYCANRFLEFILARVKTLNSTGQCYIGFSSKHEPNASGSTFSEPDPQTYRSYQRIQVAITDAFEYTNKMDVPRDGVVSNIYAFSSEQCLEKEWPEFTHFGIFDAKTGGHLLASDVLRNPDEEPDENGLYPETTLKVTNKQVAVFKVGALQLTLK